MATGQKAFPGGTGGVIIEAILSKAPTPVRTVNPEIPIELEAIINKAIEKDKEQRYHSAAELRTDLQVLKRGFESGHTQSSLLLATAGAKRLPWTKRNKWAMPGIAAGIVAAMAVGGWLYDTRRAHALSESDSGVGGFHQQNGRRGFWRYALRKGWRCGNQLRFELDFPTSGAQTLQCVIGSRTRS
jgi:hypothetical protein